MSSQVRPIKFTLEDYLLFPDDGKRHELIDGEHYMTPAPNPRHQTISSNLHRIIGGFIHEKHLGRLFSAPTDVVLSEYDVVQPDLFFIATPRLTMIGESRIEGAPDLAVEILSVTTRKADEMIKRKLYERYGVSEYWIVDPELQMIKVFRMTDHGYTRAVELSLEAQGSLTTPLLPDLSISLTDIFG